MVESDGSAGSWNPIDPRSLVASIDQADIEGSDQLQLRDTTRKLYYAMYHLVTLDASEFLVGDNEVARANLIRTFKHVDLINTLSEILRMEGALKQGLSQKQEQEFRGVEWRLELLKTAVAGTWVTYASSVIVDLVDQRHEADYSHDTIFVGINVLNSVIDVALILGLHSVLTENPESVDGKAWRAILALFVGRALQRQKALPDR